MVFVGNQNEYGINLLDFYLILFTCFHCIVYSTFSDNNIWLEQSIVFNIMAIVGKWKLLYTKRKQTVHGRWRNCNTMIIFSCNISVILQFQTNAIWNLSLKQIKNLIVGIGRITRNPILVCVWLDKTNRLFEDNRIHFTLWGLTFSILFPLFHKLWLNVNCLFDRTNT